MKITILGCGGSGGVPSLDNGWGDCDPNEPRNRRRRSSLLLEQNGQRLLIDTSPDLREQLLSVGVNRVDAVLWTHGHADHLYGIDDLRAINRILGRDLPVYGPPETIEQVGRSFGYVYEPLSGTDFYYKPVLVPHILHPGDRLTIAGFDVEVIEQDHGFSRSYGYRFGNFVYSTDVVRISDTELDRLKGIDLWIVDALRQTPHGTHSHVPQTLRWIEHVHPKRAVLTHMIEYLDYRSLLASLPEGVEPAYDGMTIEMG